MGLFDDLPVKQPDTNSRCSVNQIKLQVETEDRDALDVALAAKVSHAVLAKALNAKGFKISPSSLGRHRRGECTCQPVSE